jgi:hypothetical protein
VTLLARVSTAVVLALVIAADASAQSTAASLSGTVRDQQAAVIPGASISLRNLDTGQTHRTATDRTGDFHVIGIAPGRYEIRVELPGFTPFVEPDVGLSIGQEAALDVTLTVAAVTETIRRNSAREADFWQLDARLVQSSRVVVSGGGAARRGVQPDEPPQLDPVRRRAVEGHLRKGHGRRASAPDPGGSQNGFLTRMSS